MHNDFGSKELLRSHHCLQRLSTERCYGVITLFSTGVIKHGCPLQANLLPASTWRPRHSWRCQPKRRQAVRKAAALYCGMPCVMRKCGWHISLFIFFVLLPRHARGCFVLSERGSQMAHYLFIGLQLAFSSYSSLPWYLSTPNITATTNTQLQKKLSTDTRTH